MLGRSPRIPGFRARAFPPLPFIPASSLDDNEGVYGSSPDEGFE